MELNQVLVVEDTQKHQESAVRALGEFSVNLFDNLRDFLKGLEDVRKVGGKVWVLTDLFFPHRKGDNHGELAPLGLLVMMKCQELGIPCVVVTAGYHHGSKYHQATSALTSLRLWHDDHLVDHHDRDGSEAEANEKNWLGGLEKLKALAAKIGAG